ncbi:Glutathione S-transferase [Fragilaria crotonensis]|nr:Glutathione S-transferase [Fragilaria crotonensis]
MVLTVHHLEDSQSLRIVWFMEELGIDYELKLYKRDPVTFLGPPDLKALSPLGTAPVITDNDAVVLCETNAILDYILDKPGTPQQLRPAVGSPERIDYLFFFHGGQASLGTNVSGDFIWNTAVQKVPCLVRGILKVVHSKIREMVYEPRISKFLDVMESKLSSPSSNATQRDFVAGSFLTAADITLIYPVEQALSMDPSKNTRYPKCKAWLDRMYTRDAHKRALDKVGETIER